MTPALAPSRLEPQPPLKAIWGAATVRPPALAAEPTQAASVHSAPEFLDLGQLLTRPLPLTDVLAYILHFSESLFAAEGAAIAVLSPDSQSLVITAATGLLTGSQDARISPGQGVLGYVAGNGVPLVTPSLADDPRRSVLDTAKGPAVAAPLVLGGVTVGAMLVARAAGTLPFSEADLSNLQRIAPYAAVAIQHARLDRMREDALEELQSQQAQLQKARTDLDYFSSQLLVLERLAALGRVTASIAHEINSPLGGIMNAVRTARSYTEEYRSSIGDPEITAEDHKAIATDILDSLQLVDSAASKVAQFVRSIKTQTRAGAEYSTTFDPAAEIDATVVLLQHHLRRENVAIFTRLERGLSLSGDQGRFAVAIQNLITNAIDASEKKPGEIWVRAFARNSRLNVEVQDNGAGIQEEIRDRVFDFLFTTKAIGQGTGLGLAMVQNFVTQSFGGELSFETDVDRGTTFRISIPLVRVEEV